MSALDTRSRSTSGRQTSAQPRRRLPRELMRSLWKVIGQITQTNPHDVSESDTETQLNYYTFSPENGISGREFRACRAELRWSCRAASVALSCVGLAELWCNIAAVCGMAAAERKRRDSGRGRGSSSRYLGAEMALIWRTRQALAH